MKKILISFFVFCLSTSSVLADRTKTVSTKIGEKPDDVPCTCVFNKNRMWNPEKIVWNNEEWECSIYKEDGTCTEVQTVKRVIEKEVITKEADKPDEWSTSGKEYKYLMSDSAKRLLNADELAVYSTAKLRFIRNEIFARHGYIFKSKDLMAYFSQQAWYNPTSKRVSLSPIEADNVRLIKALEINSMAE